MLNIEINKRKNPTGQIHDKYKMDQLPLSRQTLPVLLQSPRQRWAAHTPHTCVQVSIRAHHLLTELDILIKSSEMNGKHDQYANKVLLPQFPFT